MACTKAEKTKYRLLDNMKAALNGAVFLLPKYIARTTAHILICGRLLKVVADSAISRFKALSLRLTFRQANTHPVGLNAYKVAQMGRNGTLR
jgi:hypothetical protein